jgi:hypothetical protein
MALTAEPLLDEEAVPLAVRTADTRAGDRLAARRRPGRRRGQPVSAPERRRTEDSSAFFDRSDRRNLNSDRAAAQREAINAY